MACKSGEEVCNHLKGAVLAAKSQGVPIPWESLFWDLIRWNDEVKERWAEKYWSVEKETVDESDDQSADGEETLMDIPITFERSQRGTGDEYRPRRIVVDLE